MSDPRLTKYALDEMDPDERAAFEAGLDDAARREAEAIRGTAAALALGLRAEEAPALAAGQRARVVRAARPRRRWAVPAVAASVLLFVAGGVGHLATREPVTSPAEMRSMEREQEARLYAPGSRGAVYYADTSGGGVVDVDPAGSPYHQGSFPAEALTGTGGGGGSHLRAPQEPERRAPPPFHTEAYDRIDESRFHRVADQDVSTFSIDVDTASYANVRRFLLQEGRLPPKDAVRIEELLNYFRYDYPAPDARSEHPFRTSVEVAACPWNAKHRLARVAIQGRRIETADRPASNLVFLIDVSGSMKPANKLPLLRQALKLLVARLDARDTVSIVVYAGAAGVVLAPTSGTRGAEIAAAIDRLGAGGSTNGGEGIVVAYRMAEQNLVAGAVNRVILCTDGDFNVGVTDRGSLTRLIEEKAKTGVFLSVLGFGTGNYQDAAMEELSNRGNGNYAYVDSLKEANKVLVEEMSSTLVTIAKDVKIQVFFNPKTVEGWRLVGYENRLLAKEDFNDDAKDAGEVGAGHAVTALYELVPKGGELPGPRVDPNPFVERPKDAPAVAAEGALFRLRLRYKQPEGERSTLLEEDVLDPATVFDAAGTEFRFAAAVAAFGMLLRDSPHRGALSWDGVLEIAAATTGADPGGYRSEFLELVSRARDLAAR